MWLIRLRLSRVAVPVVLMLACTAGTAAGGHSRGFAGGSRLQGDAASPTWSPDGKQIAFAYEDAPGAGAYRIVRRSSRPGGVVHTVLAAPYATNGCCSFMTWGRGSRILVSPSGGLKSVDVHGGKPKQVVLECISSPCKAVGFVVSPNREYVGVTTEDGNDDTPGTLPVPGIHLVKLRARGDPVVPTLPISGEEPDVALGFSPDSKQLVYWRCIEDGGYPPGCAATPLMAASVSGATPVPLAQSGIPGAALVPGDPSPWSTTLQWSPDGRWVAFYVNGSLEVGATSGASQPRTLPTCASDFSWSPTSKLIAVDCAGQLMTERPDGTHLTNLLSNHHLAYAGGVQWSPNGSRLLLLANRLNGSTIHVWTIRPNGHNLTRLG